MVEMEGNYLDAKPLKDRTTWSTITAYKAIWKQLTVNKSIQATIYIMYNDVSKEFKKGVSQHYKLQLIPSDTHCCKIAEHKIQRFKNQFTSILYGVDDWFQMHPWFRLLTQAKLTLNLLKLSNLSLTVSAYNYIHWAFNYDAMPMVPIGCAGQMYEEKSSWQSKWSKHSIDSWHLPTSSKHYCCHVIYLKKSIKECMSETV